MMVAFIVELHSLCGHKHILPNATRNTCNESLNVFWITITQGLRVDCSGLSDHLLKPSKKRRGTLLMQG